MLAKNTGPTDLFNMMSANKTTTGLLQLHVGFSGRKLSDEGQDT